MTHVGVLTGRHQACLVGRWGRGTNVQGSAFDIKANESARRRGEVAQMRMLNLKDIN